MLHRVSPMILSGLLILGSTGLPAMAQEAQKVSAALGADLFREGWKYDQGLGTSINISQAFRLYQKAAALGNPLAKGRLARFYFSGNGVQSDEGQAARLARDAFPGVLRAAQRNDAVAQMIVGTMYADGLGVARDSTEALHWLQKSADQNLPLAKANLGVVYENGRGVPMDITEAVKRFREAADQNSAMGQAYLGDLYHQGRGVQRDDVNAARLYRLSADQNFAHAQTNLGTMYEKGCGVERDLNEAAKWYRLAAAQGDANAIEALRCLASPIYYYQCRPRVTFWCR